MGLLDRAKGWLPGSPHQTDIDLDFHILPDLYELPHLFGLWISDPELLALKEEITGNIWSPKLYVFADTQTGFECEIIPKETNEEIFETEFLQFEYLVRNIEIRLQHFGLDKSGTESYFPALDIEWGVSDDGRLNFTYGGVTRRYVPTSYSGIEKIGFDRELVQEIIAEFQKENRFFKETFDLNTAYELIDGKLSKQEDEEGMERGYLGRPDPTTWIFGDDRYTGPMPPPVGKG